MTREHEARRVRDAALVLIGSIGKPRTLNLRGVGQVSVTEARFETFQLLLTTPFGNGTRVTQTPPRFAAEAAAMGFKIVNYRYWLDIWRNEKKTANLRWNDLEGPIKCLSFMAEPWRNELIDAATQYISRPGRDNNPA